MRETPGSFLSSRLPRFSAGAALSSLNDAQKKTDELLAYLRIVDLDEAVRDYWRKNVCNPFKEWSNDRVQ